MKIYIFPGISTVKKISGLSKAEARKLYRARFKEAVFSRHGVVGFFIAIGTMVFLRYMFDDLGRVVGWGLGCYLMYLYLFHQMDFNCR